MIEPSNESTPLRRTRPKTNWLWYIGTVSASLILGLSISYAMQKSLITDKHPINPKKLNSVAKLSYSDQLSLPVRKQPIEKSTLTTKTTKKQVKTPTHITNPTSIPKLSISTKQMIQTGHATVKKITKPTGKSKSNPSIKSDHSVKKHNSSERSTTAHDNNNGNAINQLLDRLTNTVHFLLTGKQ